MEETNITTENTPEVAPVWSKDEIGIEAEEMKNKVEHFGDPHEYILGKHIKDWEGKGIAIINGEVIELDEEQMKAVRKGSVSNSSGN